jgi:hypothetical protein
MANGNSPLVSKRESALAFVFCCDIARARKRRLEPVELVGDRKVCAFPPPVLVTIFSSYKLSAIAGQHRSAPQSYQSVCVLELHSVSQWSCKMC